MAGFGDLVRKSGVLPPDRLAFALNEQQRTGFRLAQILVDHGIIDEAELYSAVSRVSGYQRLDMSTANVDLDAARQIDPEWALEHRMMPLSVDRQNRTVVVATSDPTQSALLTALATRFDAVPAPLVATDSEVGRLIRHAYFSEPLDRTRGGSTVPAGAPVMAPPAAAPGPAAPPAFAPERPHEPTGAHRPATGRDRVPAALAMPSPFKPKTGDVTLNELAPVVEMHQYTASAIEAVFELCVARGIISREEFLARLQTHTPPKGRT